MKSEGKRKMNDNKKWIIITIILGIVIVLLSGYIVYDKLKTPENNNCALGGNNNNNNNNKATLNEELKNTTSFAIREKSTDDGIRPMLVATDNNGKETLIYDFSQNSREMDSVEYYYDSYEAKIYLSIRSYPKGEMRLNNPKYELATIDLSKNNGTYELKTLTEINRKGYLEPWAATITKVGDYVYLGYNEIYKVNLNDYSMVKFETAGKNKSTALYNYSNNLIYNINETIYKYDSKTGNKEVIIENVNLEYVYNDELIYTKRNEETYQYKYYSYNLETKEIKTLSPEIGVGLAGFSHTVPYKNSYLSMGNEDTTFYYEDDKEFTIKCDHFDANLCEYIYVESYITYSNYIKIVGTLNDGINSKEEDVVRFEMIVDLDTQEVKSVKNMGDVISFRKITYVK